MSSRTLAFDLGGLRIWLGTDPATNRDEVQIDEVPGRAEDAIGVRFGTYVRPPSDNKGRPSPIKLSIDELVPGQESDVPAVGGVQATEPRRSERLMFEFGQDDDPAAAEGAYRMDIFDQEDPLGVETDKGERRMLTLSKAKGLEVYLPINAYGGIARGNVALDGVHRFTSDNGRYVFNVQGDTERIVVYDTWDLHGQPLPESVWGATGAVGTINVTPLS